MTNPGESIDYLNRLEGPIVEALAAMEAGRLPHAIRVGEAFLAAKNIVVKDGIKTNAGKKDDNWSAWLSRICKRQRISVRTAHDYMLLARNADVSQRAASVRDALEQIGPGERPRARKGRRHQPSRGSRRRRHRQTSPSCCATSVLTKCATPSGRRVGNPPL